MKRLLAALVAVLFATAAHAQNPGTVTNHAFVVGKGPGVSGYTSLLCGSAQLAVGQSAADPICRTVSGDATLSAAGALSLATVNSNVGTFGSATQCVTVTNNAKGLTTAVSAATCAPAVGSITGLGAGVAAWLATPSSANLRAALIDETGTGLAYFQGGDIGTPSAGVATNLTGTAAGLTAGHVTTNANLTGDVTSVGNATTYSGTVPASKGGTGQVALTANAFITGNGTSPVNQVAITGLVLGNGASAPAAYGGTSCTNQFVAALSALGAATCATVNLSTSAGGTLQAAQEPAHTGDMTNSAGSLATVVTKTNGVAFGGYATISAGQTANSLGSNVALNNTASYFDGPSVAQGTTGTWFVSGTVTLQDTSSGAVMNAKLWDGTTVIASAQQVSVGASTPVVISLSGFLTSPAGNLRISVRDASTAAGQMLFNASGNSKDSTVTAYRIN